MPTPTAAKQQKKETTPEEEDKITAGEEMCGEKPGVYIGAK